MLAGYYAFGEFTLPRESLRLLAHSQRDDGLLELCAPARIPITIPSFSLAFIVALEEYCRDSGDLHFAEEMLPTSEKILNTLRRWCRDGLAFRNNDPKYWNFYEWNPLLEGYDKRDIPSAESGLQLFGILGLLAGPLMAIVLRSFLRLYCAGRSLKEVLCEGVAHPSQD